MPAKLFLALMIFTSCATAPRKANAVAPKASLSEDPKIVFVSFLMERQAENPSAVKLISVTESPGKLKKNLSAAVNAPDYLVLEISREDAPVQTIQLEHPLYKTVEYVGEDQQLKRRYVETDQADFFIRLQKAAYTQIRIFEHRKNKSKTLLKTFNL